VATEIIASDDRANEAISNNEGNLVLNVSLFNTNNNASKQKYDRLKRDRYIVLIL
jgi:hypothetical protein